MNLNIVAKLTHDALNRLVDQAGKGEIRFPYLGICANFEHSLINGSDEDEDSDCIPYFYRVITRLAVRLGVSPAYPISVPGVCEPADHQYAFSNDHWDDSPYGRERMKFLRALIKVVEEDME